MESTQILKQIWVIHERSVEGKLDEKGTGQN